MEVIVRRLTVPIVNTFDDDHPGCNFVLVEDELVIVQEHWNPYDSNAVLFLLQDGLRLGHIRRQLAAVLAPLMRTGSIRLRAKVREVTGYGNNISVMIKLTVIGINLPGEDRVALSNSIDRLQQAGFI